MEVFLIVNFVLILFWWIFLFLWLNSQLDDLKSELINIYMYRIKKLEKILDNFNLRLPDGK